MEMRNLAIIGVIFLFANVILATLYPGNWIPYLGLVFGVITIVYAAIESEADMERRTYRNSLDDEGDIEGDE